MKRTVASSCVGLLACCFAVGCAANVWAAEPVKPSEKILVAKTFRATKLQGLNVRNAKGEKLGTVHDMMIDIEHGKIDYVALSVGGLLGVGDKLFAVPFNQLKFDHGKDEMFFVLNMSKEQLQAAPGFDQSNWPNFADPHWAEQIDSYYKQAQTTKVRTTTTGSPTK